MIFNIRGSNGAGKSTLVRNVMAQFKTREPVFTPGRKQPLYYRLWVGERSGRPDLIVLGHYESECGGCDTIHSMDETYDLVHKAVAEAEHVMFEGILISLTFGRNQELHDRYGHDGFMAITLDRTAQECVDAVDVRRAAKGKDKGRPDGVISKHKAVVRTLQRMDELGMNTRLLTREKAFTAVMESMFL
jgi:hypothetical protein